MLWGPDLLDTAPPPANSSSSSSGRPWGALGGLGLLLHLQDHQGLDTGHAPSQHPTHGHPLPALLQVQRP